MASAADKRPDALARVLLDRTAPHGDRDDAALDLGTFDDDVAEAALLTVVLDSREDDDIADRAGESLAEVWKRRNKRDAAVVSRMHPAARKFFDR